MTNSVVCKFGGSSVANADQIEKVRRIVTANSQRRFVVVSAPGRIHKSEEKITDHLLNIASNGTHFQEKRKTVTASDSKLAVIDRFTSIINDLEIDGKKLLESLKQDLETKLEGERQIAFLASRGEHYNARVIAAYFQKQGMESRVSLPEDFGLLVTESFLDAKVEEIAYENIAALDGTEMITVVPGFYGVTENGEIAVFSRGGSDLTGGEIAYAIDADKYENWTDVNGVLESDPGIIPAARAIPRLTFKEIRLLSSKGVNVFHLDAMLNCRKRKIPIHVRNTNRPDDPGTQILNERVPEEGVVGIARLDNMAYIYLEKDMLCEEVGFTATLLTIFQNYGINTYHYPTDKDDIAVLVKQDDLKGSINDLRRSIEKQLKPDFMDVVYNLSIITPVGLGLKRNSYPMVDAINALGEHHIPIEMIDQSPSQICFHIGVSQAIADDALRLLYRVLIAGS
ncbi:MAG TPA: aspartate kinase [Planctomycetaceae bacterium]|uniref:aspartate kinase n=1 Tax=Gimesia sp. TaxID=2024833 RepID=UPI000C601FF2|nr:aspartate kinase [Gimesia sp.]MAX38989.1 aspartate kinase [Gimesia sp.]HAH47444.1 aspartate kinase [Planctomycetaceae bacterium]|tara:strand:- start:327 stop:1691 length:1365 start_codon:yes stop_codon:yes gene_type:complete